MHSTANPKRTDDPHDFVVVPSDQVKVAPADAEITDLLRAAARRSETGSGSASSPADQSALAVVPALDTTFRASAVSEGVSRASRRSSFGRQVMRVLVALLLALGIGGAAMGWQVFGYAAKKAFARWLPQLALTTSIPFDKLWPGTDSQPEAAPAEPVAAEEAPAQAAPAAPAQAAADSAAANPAAPPSDSAQLLRSMARDLANVSQEVETLKASIAELKASQQQMLRDRTAEQNARAKLAATPPHPPAARKPAPVYSPTPTPLPPAPAYRPTSSYPPTQATGSSPPAAQPYVPRAVEPPPPIPLQPQTEQGGLASVPRPPMPVQQ
jgi:hypothetical protein